MLFGAANFHKSLKSCELDQSPPARPENAVSQRRDDFYNCLRNCSSQSTPPLVFSPSFTEPTRQGLHRAQFFGVRQTHRLGRGQSIATAAIMPLSCKSDGLLWLDLLL